jgi:hypothetical protein
VYTLVEPSDVKSLQWYDCKDGKIPNTMGDSFFQVEIVLKFI